MGASDRRGFLAGMSTLAGATALLSDAEPATGGDTQQADDDEGPLVWQKLAPTAQIDGRYLMAGVWCVASQPSGLGLREADDPFVGGLARFVPHIVEETT